MYFEKKIVFLLNLASRIGKVGLIVTKYSSHNKIKKNKNKKSKRRGKVEENKYKRIEIYIYIYIRLVSYKHAFQKQARNFSNN